LLGSQYRIGMCIAESTAEFIGKVKCDTNH
jgi:hypothetical protein